MAAYFSPKIWSSIISEYLGRTSLCWWIGLSTPTCPDLSSSGDLGRDINHPCISWNLMYKLTCAENTINIPLPEHVKITGEEGQRIYNHIYIYLLTYMLLAQVPFWRFQNLHWVIYNQDELPNYTSQQLPQDLPSGKLTWHRKSRFSQRENSLFPWPFSPAMLNYQRVVWLIA